MENFISVGKIINTHGIKGELKIYPLTDDLQRFKTLKNVYIDGVQRNVLECKLQSNRAILKIEGIDSIDEASLYKKKYIQVQREDAVVLDEGSYFIADIIGCSVIDDKGCYYGKIDDVINTPNNDVYWIKGSKELLIPAIEDVVLNIDVKQGKIIIKPVSTWMSE